MKRTVSLVSTVCLLFAGVTLNAQTPVNDALETTEKALTKSLTLDVSDKNDIPKYIVSRDMAMELVKTTHNVNDQTQDIFAANFDNIYPGAVVYADDRLAMGDPTLAGLPYGYVTVRLDFNGGVSMKRDNVPNRPDKIQEAIHEILNSAKYSTVGDIKYKSTYASSVAEMAVGLKVDANFLKVEAKVNTNISSQQATITRVQDYTQTYYTVSITMPYDKSELFGSGVTPEQIKKKVNNAGAPLAIITSVTYGRRAYKFYDYSSSDFQFDGDQSVAGYGQKASSTQKVIKKSKAKSTWVYISGGDADSASEILKGKNLDDAIKNSVKYDKATCQGVPLYYKVQYLGTGKTVIVKSTGKYYTFDYRPMPNSVQVTFRNNASHVAGAEMKMRLDYKVVKFKDGKKIKVKAQDGVRENYNRVVEHNIGFGTKKTFPLNLGPDEYLDGPLYFQCRCKKAKGQGWANHTEGKVYPTDNVIDITIIGEVRLGGKGASVYSKSYTQILP